MGYTPTRAMQDEAQRGLDWRAEFNRGGTAVGVARARDIVNRRDLSIDTVKRMLSYFSRHEVDKQGQGWSPDEDGYPSAGRIAWALWGGDPGRAWALAVLTDSQGRSQEDAMTETRQLDLEQFSARQAAQYENDETLVALFGQYDQSSGPDGAHYVGESPFAKDGLICSNCAFYEGPRACEIVSGDIDPNGICKRWIIPAGLVVTVAQEAPMRYQALQLESRKVNGREVEYRTVTVGPLEVRSADGVPTQFRGYAAVFGRPSEPLPFIESIREGAFKRSLSSGREVRMFVNHNTDQVLASTRSGSLRLVEDQVGLAVEADLPDTSYARDLAALMQRGDVHSMSFGFSIPKGGDSWSQDGQSRELREVILHEVSVVTGFPAYPDTEASIRTDGNDDDVAVVESVEVAVERGIPLLLARRYQILNARRA